MYYQWRDRLLEGGKAALATSWDRGVSSEAAENKELRRKVAQLERALGKKTYELEVAGDSRGTGRERPCVQSPHGGRPGTSTSGGRAGGRHQPLGPLSTVSSPARHGGPGTGPTG